MYIAFTLCSNNYLAYAISLGESLLKNNPEWKFLIGIVDQSNAEANAKVPANMEVLPLSSVAIPALETMKKNYNIIEFNTSVKPFFFEHIFTQYNPSFVTYFDPDILIYDSLQLLVDAHQNHPLVMTPHFCSPLRNDPKLHPNDYDMLRTGVCNLGFVSIRREDKTMEFLRWWQAKLETQGYVDLIRGLFYDQIWMQFAPAFLDDVLVTRHLGMNVANWNLHERLISKANGRYVVNGDTPLIFFHFSNYKLKTPEVLASYNQRHTFASRPDIVPLYAEFRESLERNGFKALSRIPYAFLESPGRERWKARKRRLVKLLRAIKYGWE